MKNRLPTVLLLFIVAHVAFSQSLNFVRFSENEGLHHSQIIDISQDSNQNLWLGTTTRSIYRFDGKQFYEYKLQVPGYNGTLVSFKVRTDKQNRIWIASNLGLILFDGRYSRLIPTTSDFQAGEDSRLAIDDEDNPWMIDQRGQIFKLHHDSMVSQKQLMDIFASKPRSYFFNEKHQLCFYSSNGKLALINQSGNFTLDSLTGLGEIRTIDQNENKRVIISSSGIHVEQDGTRESFTLPSEISYQRISRAIIDKHSVIWILTEGKLFTLQKDHSFLRVTDHDNLLTNGVLILFRDSDDEIWLSVDVQGILKFKKRAWNKIPFTKGKDITALTENPINSQLLFGTYNGILTQDKVLLPGKAITSLDWDDSNELLAATLGEGAYSVNIKTGNTRSLLPGLRTDIYGIKNENGKILAAGEPGLFQIGANGSWEKFNEERVNTIHHISNPFMVNDSIYFTGMTSGVLKLAGNKIKQVGGDFLKNNTVYIVQRMKWGDYLVAGEFSQLFFFDSTFRFKNSIDLWPTISNVLLTEFTDRNHFILGSNDGLFKITLKDDSIQSIKKFGKVDGYENDELYVGASVYTKDRQIIVGTVDGAYNFSESEEENSESNPSTYLTAVDFHSAKPVEQHKGYFQIPETLNLSHDKSVISFSFSATSLSQPYNLKFRYQLKGVEDRWSDESTSQQVTYSNLPPGDYTFLVQSISESKAFGSIAQYSFSVMPAFWQTSQFYIIVFVILLIFLFIAIQLFAAYRIRQHRLREELKALESTRIKKQMSMDFHDEMGNKMAGMLAQASLLKSKEKNDELRKVFDYFERTTYAIYHGTKDFIWTIDVSSNNLSEVLNYLRDFGFNFFERNNIIFQMEEDILDAQFNMPLPDGYNRQIILIFKEAMTNALRHSGCTMVYLSVQRKGSSIEIKLVDNGTWKTVQEKGNGIRNMSLRADKLNGTLSVNRENNQSVITLSFKIAPYEQSSH